MSGAVTVVGKQPFARTSSPTRSSESAGRRPFAFGPRALHPRRCEGALGECDSTRLTALAQCVPSHVAIQLLHGRRGRPPTGADFDEFPRKNGADGQTRTADRRSTKSIGWPPGERFDGTPFTDRGFDNIPSLAHLVPWLDELRRAA